MDTSFTPDISLPRAATNAAGSQLKQNAEGQNTPEQQAVFKEEKMIAELARQQASANESTATKGTERQNSVASVASKSAMKTNGSAPESTSRAPNWSQLSAQVNGYTAKQRAMNLYLQIDRL